MRPHVHTLIHFRSVLVLFSVHENAIENKSHLDLKLMNFNIKALICAHFCFKGHWQPKFLLLHLKEHEKISRLAV
jgi:hypothetical protein